MNKDEATNQFKSIFGVEPGRVEVFDTADGSDFHRYHEAERFAGVELQLRVGILCGGEPIGLAAKPVKFVSKWRNIPQHQYDRLVGVLLSDDFRNGAVFVCLK